MQTPRGTVLQTLSLGRLLRKYTPADPSPDLAARAAVLDEVIETSTQAFVDRYREFGPTVAAEDNEDDGLADALLFVHRDRLENWQTFDRPAMHRLASTQTPDGFDYAARIDKARVAKRVATLLFGQGMDLTRLPFPEQAEHMRRITRMIEQEGLADALAELVGEDFTAALADASLRYQAMIERRAMRERGASINMREVNVALQQAIQDYMISLLSMIRDDDPDNVAAIRTALRPVDALREQLAGRGRAGSDADAGEQDDSGEGGLIEELVAEQRAVDAVVAADQVSGGAPELGADG